MKKAVMYGAGNIGRGFIGQLFNMSGYKICFLDINDEVISRLNTDGEYPIHIVCDEKTNIYTVKDVYGVNSLDTNAAAEEIAKADIIATAVGVNVLPKITGTLAKGLALRWENNNMDPLNIIICENLIDANKYLEKLVKEKFSESQNELFEKTIGLVEASIGRMVPVMTDEMKMGNPLRVYVEPFNTLFTDKDAFKGQIPKIHNMVAYSPFDYYIQRKLYMHNMGHALTAYFGFLKNYEYIYEACEDVDIKFLALRALLESAYGMSREHNIKMDELMVHAEDLVYRFCNHALKDTVSRVGRDTVRKLSEKDRLTGAARMCEKNGIQPVYIASGIAAGLFFNTKEDSSSEKIINEIGKYGLESTVLKYCGIKKGENLYSLVELFYFMVKDGKKLKDIIIKCEKIKNIKQKLS